MGCCTSDNKLTMVTCGRGASCAGECSAVQASLCPSRNCTGNPEDCSLEPHLEFEEEGDENIERCPTCSGAHLKWCVAQGCPVSTSHECCYHPKCYKQMKEECCWRDYLTGGCHLPFSFAMTRTFQAIPAHIQRAFAMEIGAVPTRRFRFLKTSTSLTQMTTSTKVN